MSSESAQSEPSAMPVATSIAAVAGGRDPAFAGIARLAAVSCGTRFASVALSGSQVVWSTSSGPVPPGVAPEHDPSTVVTASASPVVEILDVQRDARFGATPLVIAGTAIHFCAAATLRTAKGEVLGVLAVYDSTPRQLTPEQRAALGLLADECVVQAELRARVTELALAAGRPAARSPGDAQSLAAALLESAPVAIYHTDGAGNSAYFNPAYRQIFGLRPEDSDADWVQCVHPDDRERMQAAWADFRANPRPVRFEYRSDPRRSASRDLAEQVVPVPGGSGFVGSITDVTDLAVARADLRRVETLFRNTFEQAPIGIAYQDRSGTFLRCNQAFCDLLGYSGPDELRDKTISDLTHPDDLDLSLKSFERLWNGELPFVDDEKRYQHRNGHVVWVRITTALVHGGGGTPDRAVEFLRDISIRKQLAADLLRQQTLLEAVIANMPLALLACDATGSITHSNHAAEELFGLSASLASGSGLPPLSQLAMHTHLADGVTAVDRDDLPLPRALSGEVISDLELVVAPPHASPRATVVNARRLAGPGGQTLGAVAVWQDISERKAADLELERVHKQLMAASRQAGMAEVATNVLHNVGNILNSINISASLLADRVKQSKAEALGRVASLLKEQGSSLGAFMSADERGKRIPDYLTSLGAQLVADQHASLEELTSLRSNLEHIKETVAMQQSYAKLCGVTETVNVTDLVEDSLRLNAGAFARHGVTLHREYADVVPITVDKHKVLQILVNLVRNAKYACDESGRQDKLLTLRVEAIPDGVRISIIDNGVGISPDNMPRLFHHGFTTRQSGHGFGLHSGAVAAQELGGTLRAASDGLGHGASFILELPRIPRSLERV